MKVTTDRLWTVRTTRKRPRLYHTARRPDDGDDCLTMDWLDPCYRQLLSPVSSEDHGVAQEPPSPTYSNLRNARYCNATIVLASWIPPLATICMAS